MLEFQCWSSNVGVPMLVFQCWCFNVGVSTLEFNVGVCVSPKAFLRRSQLELWVFSKHFSENTFVALDR